METDWWGRSIAGAKRERQHSWLYAKAYSDKNVSQAKKITCFRKKKHRQGGKKNPGGRSSRKTALGTGLCRKRRAWAEKDRLTKQDHKTKVNGENRKRK